MKEDGLTLDHGVFPRAELFQTLADKHLQPGEGTLAGGGNPEIGGPAGMIGEKPSDLLGNLGNERIFDRSGQGGNGGFFFGELPVGSPVLIV